MNEMSFTPEEIEEGKSLAWLAYLGILFLVPMLSQKGNRFSAFHVRQGIVLLGLWVVVFLVAFLQIVLHIMLSVLDVRYLSCCVDTTLWVVQLAVMIFSLVMSIIGIVKALGGEAWKMPILGDIAQKLNFVQ